MNRFPVSVADSPLPGFRRYRNDRSTEKQGVGNAPFLQTEKKHGKIADFT